LDERDYGECVARRIDIELTSKRSESEWTWRAAGAKQPKGILQSSVLYEGAKVGDVVRADAEFEMDGITILSVSAPQVKKADEPANRIEVVGPSRKFEPVTSQLAPKGRDNKRPQKRRRDGESQDKGRKSENRRPTTQRERKPRPAAPVFKKLTPKDTHRSAVLEQVKPEERPIAEKVLRGGIPAVRTALEQENAKARTEGRPEINSAELTAIAESLLPQLKAAEWMDRAEAAKAQVDEISVRDLRAVVTAADTVARSDEARVLVAELRESLEKRTAQARETWLSDINAALDENRVVRALNLSARPPDPQVKVPQEVLVRLKEAAEKSMVADTRPDTWMKMLDSLIKSPVRRSVETVTLPPEPGDALLEAAKQAVGRVPALAKHLKMKVPPPPRPAAKKPAESAETTPGVAQNVESEDTGSSAGEQGA
jgi:hypothetical protein